MTTAEHIEIDTDERGFLLTVVDDEGEERQYRLSLAAVVDLRRAGLYVSEYVDEMTEARTAVANGVPLAEFLRRQP